MIKLQVRECAPLGHDETTTELRCSGFGPGAVCSVKCKRGFRLPKGKF